MFIHDFKLINNPKLWDEDMKKFFEGLCEYWVFMHPKANKRWKEELGMKLYAKLNEDFTEIFARWNLYFGDYCIECGRLLEADSKHCPWCGMARSMDSAVEKRIRELKAGPTSKNQASNEEIHSKPSLLERAKASSEKLPDIGDVESGLGIEENESLESYRRRLYSIYWHKKKIFYKLLIEWHMYSSEKCISCSKEVKSVQNYCPYCGNQIFKVSDETVKWIEDRIKRIRTDLILRNRPLSVHNGMHEWDREGLSYEEYMEMYYNM